MREGETSEFQTDMLRYVLSLCQRSRNYGCSTACFISV